MLKCLNHHTTQTSFRSTLQITQLSTNKWNRPIHRLTLGDRSDPPDYQTKLSLMQERLSSQINWLSRRKMQMEWPISDRLSWTSPMLRTLSTISISVHSRQWHHQELLDNNRWYHMDHHSKLQWSQCRMRKKSIIRLHHGPIQTSYSVQMEFKLKTTNQNSANTQE